MKLKKDKYYQDLEGLGYYDNLDKRTKDYKEYKHGYPQRKSLVTKS